MSPPMSGGPVDVTHVDKGVRTTTADAREVYMMLIIILYMRL